MGHPSNGQGGGGNGKGKPTPQIPTLVCGVEGCQAVSGKPVVIPKYVRCVAKSTAVGAAAGFGRGLYLALFTEGGSILIQTGAGIFAGLFGGAVGCAF